jgi:hypothetical protein
MSIPSFAQLFRRSRYSRFGLSENDAQNQERLEIFAVAAVGFALKHNLQFKQNFLKKFADIEKDFTNFEPEIQASDCTDLKLENRHERVLVVVEFKVRASLQAKQDPWLDCRKPDDDSLPFWSEASNGYGFQLGQRSYDQFSTIHYIIVRQNECPRSERICKKFGKIFHLKTKSWNYLLEPSSAMEQDLVKSLGELGIEELEDYRMKQVKIENGDLEALFKGRTAIELILYISTNKLGDTKASARKQLINFFTEGSRGSIRQIGLYAPQESLKKLSGVRSIFLTNVWFGYLSEDNKPFKAEVWFYCNESAQTELRSLLENELKLIQIAENPDEKGLRIIRADNDSFGDLEWFCKVIGI